MAKPAALGGSRSTTKLDWKGEIAMLLAYLSLSNPALFARAAVSKPVAAYNNNELDE
jgi:hypothetical protein